MSMRVKTLVMSEITKRIGDNKDFLVLNTSKVTAFKVNQLRLRAAKQGITILNVKNTLAIKALKELGVTSLGKAMSGPSALVWGAADVVALSREIVKWTKEKELKELVIKGGTVDGQALDAKGVDELSKSAGKPELLSKIAGLILAPGAQLAAALIGPGGYIAGQVKAISEKEPITDGATGESAEEAPAAG